MCRTSGRFTCQAGWFYCFLNFKKPLTFSFVKSSAELFDTICKYHVSLWCTLCSGSVFISNACLGGDERI